MTGLVKRAALGAALGLFVIVPARAAGGSDRAAALDYLGRGKAAFRVGDFAAATQDWTRTIRICRALGDSDTEAEALTRRGEAFRVAGHYKEATVDLEAALKAAELSGDDGLLAAASGALGNLAFILRRSAAAEPLLRRSHALATRLGDAGILAASANDLGNLYAATGRAAAAQGAYREAIAAAGKADDIALAATAASNLARLLVQDGDAAQAPGLLSRAVEALSRLAPSQQQASGLIAAAAVVFERAGAPDPAMAAIVEQALERAEASAETLHSPMLLSLAVGSRGHLDERQGRIEEAEKLTERALLAAQQAWAPQLSSRWEWQQGRLLRQQGHNDAALRSYRRAVEELQSVRQDIPVEYRGGHSSYRRSYGALYLQFSDLLLRKAAADPTNAAPLLKEARNSVELLKEGELQDYFRDACVTSFEAKTRPIDTLAPGTAVLYPVVLPDRLELLVSLGSEQRRFSVPVDQAVLRQKVERFRRLLEKRQTNEYLPLASELYDRLIRPLDPLLAAHHVDTLVVVPDSVLRLIPFAALYDGSHFLVERYATAIAPSLRLVDPKPLSLAARRALIAGISERMRTFPGLPYVRRELAEVHGIEGGQMLLNNTFSRERFQSELQAHAFDLVHIASHGEFGDDPGRTFVMAFDGPLTMDDLERDIKFGEYRAEPLELLTLSACETAAGDDRAALGLAGIALKSGARSALATLWFINDRASSDLVVAFYRALQRPRESRAKALQAAQRAMLRDPVFSHPAYWAPFLLVGDWL